MVMRNLCIHITIVLLVFRQNKSSADSICIADEKTALLTFKAGLSDHANLLSSWKGGDCCNWKGVLCSNSTGHVIKLDLQGPDCYNSHTSTQVLGGNISMSLIGLQHLQHLDLSCNRFEMIQIPEFLGSLHELRYLDLSQSSFGGRIPPQLGNISNLQYLNLYSSSFLGSTYSTDISWLSQLSSLEHLDMSRVNLSTITNWVSVVNKLPSLVSLNLSGCGLQTCPDILLHSNLTSLETLKILDNDFDKNIATNWFWSLTSLKYLDVSACKFHGPFPYEIGNMTSMVHLGLSMNDIAGMIPSNMNKLCNLEELYLDFNNINGSITDFFKRLPSCSWNKLRTLDLYYSNLIGSLPSNLEPLSNLAHLYLGGNNLTGPVPFWIGELTNLAFLDLRSNNLNGSIDESHLSGLKSLKWLRMSDNSLAILVNSSWVPPFNLEQIELRSCQLGPKFPAWLRWQTDVSDLDISNTSISDMMPDWFWTVASSVQNLNVRNNQISGFLPSKMEFMQAELMDLSSNLFSGPIPKLPANLTHLDISRNNLHGPLPLDFGAPRLEILLLYNNSISGTLPSSFCKLRFLQLLDLSNNDLHGTIPDCLDNESATNKRSLSISNLSLRNNNLSGEFPSFLQSCQQLIFLDLSYNKFFGALPSWIAQKLSSVAFLRLRHNMFYGTIPLEIVNLLNLQYLDFAYNNLSGSIPKSVNNWKAMTGTLTEDKEEKISEIFHPGVEVGSNEMIDYTENIMVVTKGQERLYTGEIIFMVNLDLSCNNLVGEIPEEIGNLVALANLNLSWNAFTGKIPEKIGALVQVESLDLSHNKISGEIPTTLSSLTSLSHLNLSYNNLSGSIPSGNQLQVLDNLAYAYIGNPGLCGAPLATKCPEKGSVPAAPEDPREDGNDNLSLFIALGSGYATGLWMVWCIFLFKAKWGTALFALYDRLYDRFYVQVAVGWASLKRRIGNG